MTLDPVVLLGLRLALALLFVSAAAHKLRDLAGFRAALAAYALLPKALVPAAAIGLAAIECTVGAGLLLGLGSVLAVSASGPTALGAAAARSGGAVLSAAGALGDATTSGAAFTPATVPAVAGASGADLASAVLGGSALDVASAFARASALAGVVLLVLYAAAITVNLARGQRSIDCGCGGPGGERPIGPMLIVRNLGLMILLGLSLLPSRGRQVGWLDVTTVFFAVGSSALLYAASDVAAANAARQRVARRPAWSTL